MLIGIFTGLMIVVCIAAFLYGIYRFVKWITSGWYI
jgi:hypothetical protein